uniref:hypothetical protein n=1 Tax=Dysgonomonas capnocytophagoides TaxID=45254 RepID=UPI002A828BF8
EDLAKVGTSETTSTINIFKYGIPKYSDKPILCEYTDGSSKWITKEELDSLQGNTKEIIEQICTIKSLTYYIENDCLRNTILIDTPGIDAVVGEEGDAHQEQTELFLGLRKQHEIETIALSNNADAVILLLGDVTHESDKDFINAFLKNRGVYSCLNTIGVMSQIDLTDERVINRNVNAHKRYDSLSDYVSCVLPVSAGIKRFLPPVEEAENIKMILSEISNKDVLDNILLRSEKMYLLPKLPGISLTLEQRKSIYKQGEIPFRCFAVIAKVLYENSVNDAISILDEISGIDKLKTLLDSYFFNRSYQIKCEVAIRQAILIIWEIVNCGKIDCCTQSIDDLALKELSEKISNIQYEFEKILSITEETNKDFQSFTTLVENQQLFSASEFEELKLLLSNQISVFNEDRMNFWFKCSNNVADENKREISRRAYFKYSDLAFHSQD